MNGYLDICLNCMYLGLYDKALDYLLVGLVIFKKKQDENSQSYLDYMFFIFYLHSILKEYWKAFSILKKIVTSYKNLYDVNLTNIY